MKQLVSAEIFGPVACDSKICYNINDRKKGRKFMIGWFVAVNKAVIW